MLLKQISNSTFLSVIPVHPTGHWLMSSNGFWNRKRDREEAGFRVGMALAQLAGACDWISIEEDVQPIFQIDLQDRTINLFFCKTILRFSWYSKNLNISLRIRALFGHPIQDYTDLHSIDNDPNKTSAH